MRTRLVEIGNFSFRYRGYLLPIAVILLLIPSPQLLADPAVAGLAGFLVAAFGQSLRIGTVGLAYIIRGGKDHRVYAEDLVTTGMYAHCRNPMYLGNFFLLIGLAIAANSVVFLLAGVPIGLFVHRSIVAAEEDFLRRRFGEQFDAYCARVSRWFPRLRGLLATIRSMQFDWRRVVVKEYATSFDWLSATATLVVVNLWRAGTARSNLPLVMAMSFVVLARVAMSLISKRLKNRSPAAST